MIQASDQGGSYPRPQLVHAAHHPVVWYRIEVTAADLIAAGLGSHGDVLLVHFSAADRTSLTRHTHTPEHMCVLHI